MANVGALKEEMMMMIRRVNRVWVKRLNFFQSLTLSPFFIVFPVILNLIACRDQEFQDIEKGNLVFLGVKGEKLCLFCAEIGGTPTLELKVSTCSW